MLLMWSYYKDQNFIHRNDILQYCFTRQSEKYRQIMLPYRFVSEDQTHRLAGYNKINFQFDKNSVEMESGRPTPAVFEHSEI